jgi:hypothetical protein
MDSNKKVLDYKIIDLLGIYNIYINTIPIQSLDIIIIILW